MLGTATGPGCCHSRGHQGTRAQSEGVGRKHLKDKIKRQRQDQGSGPSTVKRRGHSVGDVLGASQDTGVGGNWGIFQGRAVEESQGDALSRSGFVRYPIKREGF